MLVRQLIDLGYRVTEAGEASAALALIDEGAKVDLLLTDIVMPGKLDGSRWPANSSRAGPAAR